MEHFDFAPTPISYLPFYSNKYGVDLYVKRDDLFPSALGGSKSRMLQYILYPLVQKGIKTIVTAGGPYSNFNRALALLCAQFNIKMKLVSYTDNNDEYKSSLNDYIVSLTDCKYIYCAKNEVSETIKKVLSGEDSKTTSFIYGGGKSIYGFFSYYDAIKELKEQITDIDALFVACGTGTTLTGICAGMQEYFPKSIVYGISVARDWDNERLVLAENIKCLNSYLGTNYDFSNLIFSDKYLCGGYAKTSIEELAFIRECISKEGMIIDPTYSGKAFYGMLKTLLINNIQGKRILFWNTGGLINLLSQRYF